VKCGVRHEFKHGALSRTVLSHKRNDSCFWRDA
jgi:hypothetical protein